MSNFDQSTIERAYQNWARVYEWLTPIYLLDNEKRLRQETIASLHLQPGQTILYGDRRIHPTQCRNTR